MEAGGQIAIVTTYDGLLEALQQQQHKLGLNNETMEEFTCLPLGYIGKLFGPAQVKRLGPVSLDEILHILGVQLVIVENIEAAQKTRARIEAKGREKTRSQARFEHHAHLLGIKTKERVKPVLLSEWGRRGIQVRNQRMSPRKRRQSARHAAKARWAGVKRMQRLKWKAVRRAQLKNMQSCEQQQTTSPTEPPSSPPSS
jgi:hypothetical protein